MATVPSDILAFLDERLDSREYKRGLAVKLSYMGFTYAVISTMLDTTISFVGDWKQAYQEHGVDGLRLAHKGSIGFLTPEQHQEILDWLQKQTTWSLEELQHHIEDTYHVVYKSQQSYYALFAEAKISWKRTQKSNPQKNPVQVAEKKKEISDFIQAHEADIRERRVIVLYLDECHLVWGDACGYAWGKAGERIDIPMKNYKQHQTYFGAIDHYTKDVIVREYTAGNGESAVDFVQFLREMFPAAQLVLIWDGASYHTRGEMKTYLETMNTGLDEENWRVRCILFAPNAPEQNPIEAVWLQGKQYIRKNWHLCDRFQRVKELFLEKLKNTLFDFDIFDRYGGIPEII